MSIKYLVLGGGGYFGFGGGGVPILILWARAEWPTSRHRIASVFASWGRIAKDFHSENAHRQDYRIASHRLFRV